MSAGDKLFNTEIATRVATGEYTSDSGTITTTQTSTMSISPYLQDGRRYALMSYARISSSVAGDAAICRIREDSATGTEIGSGQVYCGTNSTVGFTSVVYAEFTATADGAKTFHHTVVRNSGTGNIIHRSLTTSLGRFTCTLLPD